MRLLAGVRVLDLGRLMPSAIATAELAKLGADVVKVEIPPYGDYFRATAPLIRGRGDMHLNLNRSKRSLCLDFRKERGRAVLLRLAAKAHVFLEVSKPGTMEAFGLGYADVRQVNPGIVYCSISGYGQTGPYRALPAHGLSADTSGGLLGEVDADGNPEIPGSYVSVGPRVCGLNAAIAILGSLYRQQATGEGQYLDVSQADAAVAWNYRNVDNVANVGKLMPSYDTLGPRYTFYRTADGKHVLFAATERKLWEAFCDGVGRPELKAHAGDDVVSYDEDEVVRRALVEIIGGRTRNEWVAFGAKTGVPIAPLVQPEELPTDPHVLARGMVATGEHPLGGEVALTGHPVKFGDGEVEFRPAPELGADSVEVLAEYEFGDEEVGELMRERVVLANEKSGTSGRA